MPDEVVPPVVPAADQPPATPPAAAPPAASPPAPEPVVAPPVVPETYDLKLPADSTLDAAIVERTGAIARTLGLGNDAAQKLLESLAGEVTTSAKAASEKAAADALEAARVANLPGGAEWTKRQTDWQAAIQADPDVGGEKFEAATERAKQGMERVSRLAKVPIADMRAFMDTTGMGSHPVVFKAFEAIGRAMSEGGLVQGSPPGTGGKSAAEILYGPDGMGPKTQVKVPT